MASHPLICRYRRLKGLEELAKAVDTCLIQINEEITFLGREEKMKKIQKFVYEDEKEEMKNLESLDRLSEALDTLENLASQGHCVVAEIFETYPKSPLQ